LIETIAWDGIVNNIDDLFIVKQPNPVMEKSDGTDMLPLDQLEGLLCRLVPIR